MKKIAFALLALSLIACNKEIVVSEPEDTNLIPKSFTAVSPETKTALDGLSVKWSANDEICVIAKTTGNKYTFTISSGDEGKSLATFTGNIDAADAAETVFYAVYPNQPIRTVDTTNGKIVFDKTLNNGNSTQTAVENGFDPAYSVMIATSDDTGVFSFSHRSAYLKLTVGNENVSNINIKTSSTRFYGRPTIPIADSDMGTLSNYAIDGAADNINLGGTLVQGKTYYIPIPVKNSKVGTLTITYSFNDGTPNKSLSADVWQNNYFAVGKIYNLGTPTVSVAPEISASDITIEDDAESGTINFTVSNPASDGVASYSVAADGLSNATWNAVSYDNTTGVGSIDFTCDANTDTESPKTATIHIVYKDSSDNIYDETDVTVTQKKKPSGTTTKYTWTFTNADVMSSAWSGSGDYTWVSDTAGQTINYNYSKDQIVQYPSSSGNYCMKTTGDAKPTASSARRVFTYSAPASGTLIVKGYQQGSNDGTLTVTLNGSTVSANTGSPTAFGTELTTCEYTIASAGTVEFYTVKKSYFYSVEFIQ